MRNFNTNLLYVYFIRIVNYFLKAFNKKQPNYEKNRL